MSWLSSIERKWRHLIDDLGGFFGTIVDFVYAGGWYTTSKWIREYETYYNVSSTPLLDDWTISNELNGAIISHTTNPSVSLSTALKEASLNGIYSRFNHIAKKVCNNPKYRDVLGKPTGTEFNTKISLKALSNATSLEVTDYDYCNFNSLLHSYNYLVETYNLVISLDKLIFSDGQEIKEYPTLGTLTYNGKTYYLVDIYPPASSSTEKNIHIKLFRIKSIEEITNLEPEKTELIDIEIPIKVENGEFYYIHHNTQEGIRIAIYSLGEIEALDNIFQDKPDLQYPTLVLKAFGVYTKEQRFQEDLPAYDLYKKLLKRSSFDWEDIYNQICCNDVDNETNEDKSYKEELNNTTNILISLACDITTNNQVVIEYLFKLFKQYNLEHSTLGSTGGELFYKHAVYEHKVTWDKLSISTKQGHVCHWKQYASETKDVTTTTTEIETIHTNSGSNQRIVQKSVTDKVLCIYYQQSKDTYIEINVTGLQHITNAFGKEFKTDLPTFSNMKPRTRKDIQKIIEERDSLDENANTDNSEFLIPLYPVIVRKLGAYKGSTLISVSLRILWQAEKRVKKKWYATTGFKVIRCIAAIIVIICTWGTATPFVIAANAALNIALNILIQVLISVAIKLAVKYVCKIFNIDGMGLVIANMVTNICEMAVGTSMGFSSSMTSLSSGLADMVTSGSMTLDNFANALSNSAFMSLAGSSPITATIYKLVQDPQYLEAIQNHKWSEVLITTSATLATAMSINSMETKNVDKPQYETLKYGIKDNTPSLGESFMSQIKTIGTKDIVQMPLAYNNIKTQITLDKIQRNLEELQAKLATQEKIKESLEERSNLLNSIVLNQSLIGV